jgi:hypothetical protein
MVAGAVVVVLLPLLCWRHCGGVVVRSKKVHEMMIVRCSAPDERAVWIRNIEAAYQATQKALIRC